MSTSILGIATANTMNVSSLYIRGVDVHDLFVSPDIFTQTNTSVQLQLQGYVTTTALNTTLAGYQRTVNSSNKINYSFLLDPPDLSIYATNSVLTSTYVTNTALATTLNTYQTKITSENKIPYSNISDTPNLNVYAPLASPTFTGTVVANTITSSGGQDLVIRSNNGVMTNLRLNPNGAVAISSLLTNALQNFIIRPLATRDLIFQIDTGSVFADVMRINGSTGII